MDSHKKLSSWSKQDIKGTIEMGQKVYKKLICEDKAK